MQYFTGLIGIIIGLAIIKYRYPIREFTGTVSFAERYLGSGGTYTFYLLLGAVIIFLSVLYATGQLQSMLTKFIGPLF
jgi:energy-converting hydrogenase Eha subunit A